MADKLMQIRLEFKSSEVISSCKSFHMVLLSLAILTGGCSQFVPWTSSKQFNEPADGQANYEPSEGSGDKLSSTEERNSSQSPSLAPVPLSRIIRVDGNNDILGSAIAAPKDNRESLTQLDSLLRKGDRIRGRQLIQQHPEIFREAIFTPTADFPRELYGFTAQVLDEVEGVNTGSSWSQVVHALDHPSVDAYLRARRDFVANLGAGWNTPALSMNLLQLASGHHDLIRTDAALQIGMEQLLSNAPAEALQSFEAGLPFANRSSRAIQSELKLMASEASRRIGDTRRQNLYYAESTAIQVEMMSGSGTGIDASYWSRAIHLRPNSSQTDWSARQQLSDFLKRNNLISPEAIPASVQDEGAYRLLLSFSHYQRGEVETALVGFKEAETLCDEPNQSWAQLWQAKCLLRLGQDGVGLSILTRLKSSSPLISAATTCMLGSYSVQNGKLEKGVSLLEQGLAQQNATWPGRSQAEADLGLAYLLLGKHDDGLSRLHQAQQTFQRAGQIGELLQSLENEERFLNRLDRNQESNLIASRIQELQTL